MAKYFRAADLLHAKTITSVMDTLVDINPDWPGGLIYFPSVSATTGLWPKNEVAVKRAQAVVFTEDGYSESEAAAMIGVSRQTVKAWRARYGEAVRVALAEVRKERSDG